MQRTPEEVEKLLDYLAEVKDHMDKSEDEYQRKSWKERHPEFDEYDERLKQLNGDDFDIFNSSYDEYHNSYSDLSEEEYTSALKANIEKTLKRIWPDAEPEKIEEAAEEAADSVKEDDLPESEEKNESEEPETAEVTTVEKEEVPVEEVPETVEEKTDGEVKEEEVEDEMEEFQKSLDKEYEKQKKYRK